MRCDDADVMMMQKQKQTKSNLGKNPGALQCIKCFLGSITEKSKDYKKKRFGWMLDFLQNLLFFFIAKPHMTLQNLLSDSY